MNPSVYNDNLKIRDALQTYFSKYHFENGGYHLKWFKIKIGKLFIPLPNTKARIDAVKIHDIHHILTEYPANLKGEAEIGAWEIASGCGPYYMAWILNYGSFHYGMYFFPRTIFRSFMAAKRCNTNLYHNVVYDENLLNKTVGELREYVGINSGKKNTAWDYFGFAIWCLLALVPIFVLAMLIC